MCKQITAKESHCLMGCNGSHMSWLRLQLKESHSFFSLIVSLFLVAAPKIRCFLLPTSRCGCSQQNRTAAEAALPRARPLGTEQHLPQHMHHIKLRHPNPKHAQNQKKLSWKFHDGIDTHLIVTSSCCWFVIKLRTHLLQLPQGWDSRG